MADRAAASIIVILNHRTATASASDGVGDLVVGLLVPVVLILLELVGNGGGDGFLRVLHQVDDAVEDALRHAQGLGQLPRLTGDDVAGVGQYSVLNGRLRKAQSNARFRQIVQLVGNLVVPVSQLLMVAEPPSVMYQIAVQGREVVIGDFQIC